LKRSVRLPEADALSRVRIPRAMRSCIRADSTRASNWSPSRSRTRRWRPRCTRCSSEAIRRI